MPGPPERGKADLPLAAPGSTCGGERRDRWWADLPGPELRRRLHRGGRYEHHHDRRWPPGGSAGHRRGRAFLAEADGLADGYRYRRRAATLRTPANDAGRTAAVRCPASMTVAALRNLPERIS